MTAPDDRRFEPRLPVRRRMLAVAAGLELSGLAVDESKGGLRLRLDRPLSLPKRLVLIDIVEGLATEAEVAWQKGAEVGLKRTGAAASLRGLVPSRLMGAREAWGRAGGR